jgi:hypothetical protein
MTGPIAPETARTLMIGSALSLLAVVFMGAFALGIADIIACR